MDTNYAIGSLLEVLDSILHDAANYAAEALAAIRSGEQNQAIGTIIYIEDTLPAAVAIHKAALTLHRLPRKGGAQ